MAAHKSIENVANQPRDIVSHESAAKSQNPTSSILNQNAHPFTFIDESQRRHSVHMRKTIRSHIRRGISAKQRQLNAEARPRALGQKARKLLRRSNEANATSLEKRGREDVGRAGHHQRADESSILAPGDPFGGTLPQNNAVESQRVPLQITGASMDISLSILTQEEKRLALLPLQRQQFNIATPYALQIAEGAPILQIDGRRWPFPQPAITKGPDVSVWMPSVSIRAPDPKLPRPQLWKNANAVSWIFNSLEYLIFKDRLISWVNMRLPNLRDATHADTIGAIMCLISWEIARGNVKELATHRDGLERIINLLGGLCALTSIQNFIWKLQLIDLLVAIQTNSEPRFPQIVQSGPTVLHPQDSLTSSKQILDSPLWGKVPFADILAASPFCPQTRKILQNMRDLTDRRHMSSQQLEMCPIPDLQLPPSSLFCMIYYTATIYSGAFSDPRIPFHSPRNTAAVKIICAGLEDASNREVWSRYAAIYLWVALTANAAALKLPELAFITMLIVRCGTSAVFWGEDAANATIRKFILVKTRAEGSSEG